MTAGMDLRKYLEGLTHEIHTEIMRDVNAAHTALSQKFGAMDIEQDAVVELVEVISRERAARGEMAAEIYRAEMEREIHEDTDRLRHQQLV